MQHSLRQPPTGSISLAEWARLLFLEKMSSDMSTKLHVLRSKFGRDKTLEDPPVGVPLFPNLWFLLDSRFASCSACFRYENAIFGENECRYVDKYPRLNFENRFEGTSLIVFFVQAVKTFERTILFINKLKTKYVSSQKLVNDLPGKSIILYIWS